MICLKNKNFNQAKDVSNEKIIFITELLYYIWNVIRQFFTFHTQV